MFAHREMRKFKHAIAFRVCVFREDKSTIIRRLEKIVDDQPKESAGCGEMETRKRFRARNWHRSPRGLLELTNVHPRITKRKHRMRAEPIRRE